MIKQFSCTKCGNQFTDLLKDIAYPPCPICGSDEVKQVLATLTPESSSPECSNRG